MSSSMGALHPGPLLADRYRIISEIGQGGFATVYKAQDLDRRKVVAIKQITLSQLSPQEMIEVTDSYNREIMYLSRLRHEHLPLIYDHFTDPEHWYVVMDYIEGETLDDMLAKARHGRFPVTKVLSIGITLCKVLQHLHTRSPAIIFRDVKPANIMMTRAGRLYLIDFGIARQYRPEQAKDTGPLGSPGYAAPEQYGKAQSTVQTDIYGLGATLQTLLTGKEPLEIQVEGLPPGISISKNVQALLTQMLEPEASQRPQSMEEVKQSLQHLKDQSASERLKRALTATRDALQNGIPEVVLLVGMLFFLYVFGFLVFDTPFWLPYLLLIPAIIIGRSTLGLYQQMKEASTRPKVKEVVALLWKFLRSSLLYALLGAFLLYCLYASQQPDSPFLIPELLLLGVALCAAMTWILYHFISWLSRLRASRRQAHQQQAEEPPLQQQVHRPRP